MVLSTRTACSKARRLHRKSRNETSASSHLITQSVVSSLKTAPPDPRKSVVKEQVGFNLQTERLTPVNLKFIKLVTPSPNVFWEFSPSKVNAPRTAPLFIHVLSSITASLDLVCQHSPGAKFCSQGSGKVYWFRVRSYPSTWSLSFRVLPTDTAQGTLPHVTRDHICKVPAFCQTFFKEGNWHEKDSLSCLHTRQNKGCLFLAVTTAFPEK